MAGRHDVVITGIGVVTPIGLSVGELLASLRSNRSGIGLWQSPLLGRDLPAGLIARDFSAEFTKLELPYLDRCTQIALLAARQVTADAGVDQFGDAGARAGLFALPCRGTIPPRNSRVIQAEPRR